MGYNNSWFISIHVLMESPSPWMWAGFNHSLSTNRIDQKQWDVTSEIRLLCPFFLYQKPYSGRSKLHILWAASRRGQCGKELMSPANSWRPANSPLIELGCRNNPKPANRPQSELGCSSYLSPASRWLQPLLSPCLQPCERPQVRAPV